MARTQIHTDGDTRNRRTTNRRPGPSMATTGRGTAAAILRQRDEIEDAARALIENEDWNGLARLVIDQAPILLAQGRARTVEEWLSRLPHRVVQQQAWLNYWLGMCRLPYDLDRSRLAFTTAFELFNQQRDADGVWLSWAGAVETILAAWGDMRLLDHWTDALETLRRRRPVLLSPAVAARIAAVQFGAYMFRQPHHPHMRELAARALHVSAHNGDLEHRMQTAFYGTIYHLWIGDIASARMIATPHREITRTRRIPPHLRLMWSVADAACDWHMALHERCLKTVSKGLNLSRSTGAHVWDYQLMAQGVYGALAAGDLAQAQRYLEMMSLVPEGLRPLDASHHHFLSAWHALLKGDLAMAFSHIRKSLALAVEIGAPFPEALCHLAMAQVRHERRERRQASSHLAKACRIGTSMRSDMLRFMALLAKAQFALADGRASAGIRSLRAAMALGRRHGYLNTPWWRASVMARLCVAALQAGIEVEYVRDLVQKRGLIPDTPPIEVEAWPWPLQIYTLGEFRVVRDGRPLEFSGKVQRKPLALLKALIACGRREVAEDQLADALWPDADSDVAHQAFKTTLHRLRQLVGHEQAITRQEGRVGLDPRYCWVDVWAFERLLEAADVAGKAGQTDRAVACVEQALRLYRGPFLGGDAAGLWAIPLCERVQSLFLRRVATHGRYCEQAGEWREAIDWYQRGLEADDLAEELYQRLIVCYERLGRRAEALAVYQRCRRVLAARGITPSPDTEALHLSLRQAALVTPRTLMPVA